MSNELALAIVVAVLWLAYQWGGWTSLRDCLVGLGIAHVLILFVRIL
jgi:hypothetical protein